MGNYGKITATARYVPEKIVKNDDLADLMDTNDEWIRSRTGIEERRIATEENTSDLCIQVAKRLLEKSGSTAQELDFILVATMSPDYTCPSVACMVQGALAASNAFAFDITAACSGFVYALATAERFIRSGSKKGLVIGGEKISKLIDWQDRSTAVLFGDGAAGVLLEAAEEPHFLRESLAADGSRGSSLLSGYQANDSIFAEDTSGKTRYLSMNGRDIFDFVVSDVAKSLQAFAADDAEIDYYLLHQANRRLIDKLARKLKVAREKFPTNLEHYGNTSAASIPLLLDEMAEAGQIHLDGSQKVVLTGFGGGLTWGSVLLRL